MWRLYCTVARPVLLSAAHLLRTLSLYGELVCALTALLLVACRGPRRRPVGRHQCGQWRAVARPGCAGHLEPVPHLRWSCYAAVQWRAHMISPVLAVYIHVHIGIPTCAYVYICTASQLCYCTWNGVHLISDATDPMASPAQVPANHALGSCRCAMYL